MNFADTFFIKKEINYNALIPYGFKPENNLYIYKKKLDDNFSAIVMIDSDNHVYNKLIDIDTNTEFIAVNIKDAQGAFIGDIKEKYSIFLNDLVKNICLSLPFSSAQANRIVTLVKNKYGDILNYPFKRDEGAVFKLNDKWYALILNIDKSKLTDGQGKVEILCLKSDDLTDVLLQEKGIYKAYHMNKKNWISLILDDSLSDEMIMRLLDYARNSLKTNKFSFHLWLVPIKGKYDLAKYFSENNNIFECKKNINVRKGDDVFIYQSEPYKAIKYHCKAIDISDNKMSLKMIREYSNELYPLYLLKEYGFSKVNKQQAINPALRKILIK